MGTTSVTFVSRETARANEIGGAVNITRTETVHSNGLVEWSVRGTGSDGTYTNERGTRQHGTELDLDRVTAARLSSGWSVVSKAVA